MRVESSWAQKIVFNYARPFSNLSCKLVAKEWIMRSSLNNHHQTKLTTALVLLMIAVLFSVVLLQRPQTDSVSNSSFANASHKSPDRAVTSRAGVGIEDKTKLREWTANLPMA